MEASPSGRTNGLRIPWVDGTIQDDHGVDTEGSSRPDERSQVAGVLQPIQKQQPRRFAVAELAEIEPRLGADAEDALWVLGGGEVVQVGIVHLFGLEPLRDQRGGEGSARFGTEQSRRLDPKADVRSGRQCLGRRAHSLDQHEPLAWTALARLEPLDELSPTLAQHPHSNQCVDSMDNPPPVALTIAGSDSGGGAGIQADLKTFHAFGVFGCSALTAVTAQNTLEVAAVHAIPEEMVRAQIRAVASDISVDAVKTGMLVSAALVETVAHAIMEHRLPNYVLDPVMISTSGHRLLDREAEDTIRRELIPLAAVATPNLHEARILTGLPVQSPSDLADAARAILDLGARAALVKGGHMAGGEVVDLLLTDERELIWSRPRISTPAGHGTGCTLSAALTAGLAAGRPLADAAAAAVDFVARALADAPGLGAGRGPINHFVGARPDVPESPRDV